MIDITGSDILSHSYVVVGKTLQTDRGRRNQRLLNTNANYSQSFSKSITGIMFEDPLVSMDRFRIVDFLRILIKRFETAVKFCLEHDGLAG